MIAGSPTGRKLLSNRLTRSGLEPGLGSPAVISVSYNSACESPSRRASAESHPCWPHHRPPVPYSSFLVLHLVTHGLVLAVLLQNCPRLNRPVVAPWRTRLRRATTVASQLSSRPRSSRASSRSVTMVLLAAAFKFPATCLRLVPFKPLSESPCAKLPLPLIQPWLRPIFSPKASASLYNASASV